MDGQSPEEEGRMSRFREPRTLAPIGRVIHPYMGKKVSVDGSPGIVSGVRFRGSEVLEVMIDFDTNRPSARVQPERVTFRKDAQVFTHAPTTDKA